MHELGDLTLGGLMHLSAEARLISGITLLVVPTILYGGWALLGILTHGAAAPLPAGVHLDATQWALWRAGHAHAGVWTVLSLVLQVLLDAASLPSPLRWLARISAPLAAIAVSGGFFGLAFSNSFRWLVYAGATLLLVALLATAIGLLRGASAAASAR
jgi:hypothetical protein